MNRENENQKIKEAIKLNKEREARNTKKQTLENWMKKDWLMNDYKKENNLKSTIIKKQQDFLRAKKEEE